MPIFEFLCADCGVVSEHLILGSAGEVVCPDCGSGRMRKLLSASSSASGVKQQGRVPGPKDTACCGERPGTQGCIPGSCCGKAG